jgi:hypothetical protein
MQNSKVKIVEHRTKGLLAWCNLISF